MIKLCCVVLCFRAETTNCDNHFCILFQGCCSINSEVFLSLPCVLGANGVIEMVELDEDSLVQEKLQSSAGSIHDLQQQLKMWAGNSLATASARSGQRSAMQKCFLGTQRFTHKTRRCFPFLPKSAISIRVKLFNAALQTHFLFERCTFDSQNEQGNVQECFT